MRLKFSLAHGDDSFFKSRSTSKIFYLERSGTPPCDPTNIAFPVVSADSDHRLLSLQPFGLLWGKFGRTFVQGRHISRFPALGQFPLLLPGPMGGLLHLAPSAHFTNQVVARLAESSVLLPKRLFPKLGFCAQGQALGLLRDGKRKRTACGLTTMFYSKNAVPKPGLFV